MLSCGAGGLALLAGVTAPLALEVYAVAFFVGVLTADFVGSVFVVGAFALAFGTGVALTLARDASVEEDFELADAKVVAFEVCALAFCLGLADSDSERSDSDSESVSMLSALS